MFRLSGEKEPTLEFFSQTVENAYNQSDNKEIQQKIKEFVITNLS